MILWKLRAGTGAAIQCEAFPQPRAGPAQRTPWRNQAYVRSTGAVCLQTLALLCALSPWGLCIQLPEGRMDCRHLFTGEEA